jgi:RNA polymerase sigma factor (sigma-70 family)
MRNLGGASSLFLKTLFEEGTATGLTDGQLLERFAIGGGDAAEIAFATLVERHGPMVIRTCQGILRDDHEAMDAFQATFLVLVRKGPSLWVRDSLGPWLHRVASRAARRARAGANRRRAMERGLAEATRRPTEERDGLVAAVHEALDRLPDRYRVPIVLCDLEGRTCEEAARHVGCPIGTIGSRLARGRERLRGQLVRRGLARPAGLLSAGHTLNMDAATMPETLVEATIQAAMYLSSGGVRSGKVLTAAATLAESVMTDMLLIKLKAAGALVTVGALATSAVVLAMQGVKSRPEAPRAIPDRANDAVVRPIERAAEDAQELRLRELERKFDRIFKILDAPDTDPPSRTITSFGFGAPGGGGARHDLSDAERLRKLERRVDRLDYKLDQILESFKQSKTPQP